jgi:hypothetical protein
MKKIAIILLLIFVACGKKLPALVEPFGTVEELTAHHLRCVEANDAKCINTRLLSYSEFHNSVYASLPEAKDGTVSENDYWGWTLADRQKAVRKLLMNYGGQKLVKVTVGEPSKILRLSGLKILRDIPVTAEWLDEKTGKKNVLVTRELLKAVVELNGQYKLWNMNYE